MTRPAGPASPRPGVRRKAGIAAGAAASLALAAGCSSPGGGQPSPQASLTIVQHRVSQVMAPLVACFIAHHRIRGQQISGKYGASAWLLHDGKIVANRSFGDWLALGGDAIMVSGQQIGTWAETIARDPSRWPSSLCGPLPSPISRTPVFSP
jgi:hypothetical protein